MSLFEDDGDEDDGEVIAEMNTTPLIDVMLVLLIMLIITIPIQTHAVKLNMPTNAPPPDTIVEPPPVVEVSIAPDGAILWDGIDVRGRKDLEYRIGQAARLEPQPEVHLRPDRAARYEIVAMVMASSQRLGLTKIGLTGSEQFVGQ